MEPITFATAMKVIALWIFAVGGTIIAAFRAPVGKINERL